MILSIENLSFSYGKKEELLKNISFEADKGDVISVIGPNGAGKTTLFKCILGQLRPDCGRILVDGRLINELNTRELAKQIAYIPQLMTASFDYSVIETVMMGTVSSMSLLSLPGKSQHENAIKAIDLVGVGKLADRKMSSLSGGEKQLVYIARAIAQNASILIMDEPTSSLDYGNQIRIMNTVKFLASEGYTVLISMHNPKAARKYSNKTLAVFDGEMKAFGLSESIITEEFINELYSL